jgi:ribosomal protein L11 methyltransferase
MSGWQVLTARVPDALDDEIAAVLGAGSLGVEVASSGPGMSELRIYLAPAEGAPAWRERAARVLAAHGLTGDDAGLSIDSVADGRWVERWQASLAPIPLGDRFVVLPIGPAAPRDGREPIRLIPGMAFGTGEHETTRLAAAAVERHVTPGSRWLDLGTGTGLLAIVATRCGAARVDALDSDPEAARVASKVAAGTVEVRAGSLELVAGSRFDGIVANIQSSFFLASARLLADALRPRGVLLASGFLDEDVAEVGAALEASGIELEARASDGPWVCLLARRRPA